MKRQTVWTAMASLCLLASIVSANAALGQEPKRLEPQPTEEVPLLAAAPAGPVEYPFGPEWHAGFARSGGWGRPVAIVVPPTVRYQTIWSWGVATTQIAPISPQFEGPFTGYPYEQLGPYAHTPYWPNDTRQFGVYYIRGPW